MSSFFSPDNGSHKEEQEFPAGILRAEDYVEGRTVTPRGFRRESDTEIYPEGSQPLGYYQVPNPTPESEGQDVNPYFDNMDWEITGDASGRQNSTDSASQNPKTDSGRQTFAARSSTGSNHGTQDRSKGYSTCFDGLGSYWEARIEQKLSEQRR